MTKREYFSPDEAAAYLDVSIGWLAKLRMRDNQGSGPKFYKVGRSIRYDQKDLDQFLENLKEG